MAYEEPTIAACGVDVLEVRDWLLKHRFKKAADTLGNHEEEYSQHVVAGCFNIWRDRSKPGRGSVMTKFRELRIKRGMDLNMLASAIQNTLIRNFPNGHAGRRLKIDPASLSRFEREAPPSIEPLLMEAIEKYFEMPWAELMTIHPTNIIERS